MDVFRMYFSYSNQPVESRAFFKQKALEQSLLIAPNWLIQMIIAQTFDLGDVWTDLFDI